MVLNEDMRVSVGSDSEIGPNRSSVLADRGGCKFFVPEIAFEHSIVGRWRVLAQNMGMNADKATARQFVNPSQRQRGKRLRCRIIAINGDADAIKLAVALIFKQSARKVGGIMGGSIDRRANAHPVA